MRTDLFAANSRYARTGTTTYTAPDGRMIEHLARRFVPPPERFDEIGEHTVGDGERLDLIAHLHLNDPEQFWRIADANPTLAPQALEAVGRRLRITLPEGMPAPRDE